MRSPEYHCEGCGDWRCVSLACALRPMRDLQEAATERGPIPCRGCGVPLFDDEACVNAVCGMLAIRSSPLETAERPRALLLHEEADEEASARTMPPIVNRRQRRILSSLARKHAKKGGAR